MRKVGAKIPIEECKRRALAFMQENSKERADRLFGASQVAMAIWPEASNMRAQGAGLIGARILHLLEKDKTVRWASARIGKWESWGYQLTALGRVKRTELPCQTS